MGRLEGKVILINGAGSGIGKACAQAYAAEGAKVVVASQSRSSERVAQEIVSSGGNAVPYSCDISDEAAVIAMTEFAVSTYGRLDVMHSNAAMTALDVISADRDIVSMDVDLWDRTMAVNLRGTMLCCKHALRQMLKQGAGNIVVTGSAKALQGDLAQSAYGASKAGVHNLVYNIAAQYGKAGIRADILMVGLVVSEATSENFPESFRKMMERHVLTQHIGTPQDCAKAAVFLASDESRYTTGQSLMVDGGYTNHAAPLADLRDMFATPVEDKKGV